MLEGLGWLRFPWCFAPCAMATPNSQIVVMTSIGSFLGRPLEAGHQTLTCEYSLSKDFLKVFYWICNDFAQANTQGHHQIWPKLGPGVNRTFPGRFVLTQATTTCQNQPPLSLKHHLHSSTARHPTLSPCPLSSYC